MDFFLKPTAFIFSVLLLVSCGNKSKDRPNIIFIMTDDQATRTVSAYDGAINGTPNIDRLAEEGVKFQNSFVTNSICNPSRASILTGKYGHKNGVVGNASPWNNQQTLLPRLLQKAGYKTALIGKWHLNSPPGDEFDYSNRLIGAGKQGFYYNPDFETGDGKKEKVTGHSTNLVTGKALDWLSKETEQQENPFMLFVQYKAPHVPRMPQFQYLDRYAKDSIPEPKTLYDDYDTRAPYAQEANMKIHYNALPLMEDHNPEENIYFARMDDEQRRKWHRYKDPETKEYQKMKAEGLLNGKGEKQFAYQKFIKDYLRLIDGVDANMGKLLDWLDEHPDIKNNTLVVFTSDQGFFTGQHGWAEKRFMYEESLQTPLLMRWPNAIEAGQTIDRMVQNIDFAPTFLDAAGIEIPNNMQGRSFKPMLDGEEVKDWRRAIYYHYYDHGIHNVPRHEGVRTDRYKLIHFYTNNAWEFYDLREDPYEVRNFYGNKEYNEVIDTLKQKLKRLRNKYEVPADHLNPPYVEAGKNQKL
jgi:arylsulfatase A-like enzyme